MVERSSGPFHYYDFYHHGVTGDTIRAHAQDPATHAGAVNALASELEGDQKRVAKQVEGDIKAGLTVPVGDQSKHATSLARNGTYAVGLMDRFAKYVDTYDTSTSTLNDKWRSQVNSIVFGMQHDPDYRSGDLTIDRKEIGDQVERQLRPQHNKALHKLDDDADEIARMFKQGPTDANVKELILEGSLPMTVTKLFPGVKITPAELPKDKKALLDILLTWKYWLPDPSNLAWKSDKGLLNNLMSILSSDEFGAVPMGLAAELLNRYRITNVIVATNPEASAALKAIVPVLTDPDPYTKLPSGLFVPKGGSADPTVAELAEMAGKKGFSTPGKPFLVGDPEGKLPTALPKWASTTSKFLGVAGVGLTMYGTGAETWNADNKEHPEWSTTHKVVDTTQKTIVVGGSSAAGAWVGAEQGAQYGAILGSFIGPEGTVVGGIVGGVVGGFVGSKAGHAVGEAIEDVGSAVSSGVSHAWHSVFG